MSDAAQAIAQAAASDPETGDAGGTRTAGAAATAQPELPRPRPGDELVLDVHALAFGGEGVARVGESGYVVFVSGAVPGDRVRALVYKRKRSYAHARALEILEPSRERVPPRASHPGVPWQVLPYERQLQIKREQVDEALRRLGHLDGFELADAMPAVQQWRYRNKLEYSFGTRRGGDGERELICGFHAAAGAREVTAMDDCLLASERGNEARELVLEWCRAQGLEAWERAPRREREQGAARPGSDPLAEQEAARPGSDPLAEQEAAQPGSDPLAEQEAARPGPRAAQSAKRGRRDARTEREQRTAPAPDGRARLRNVVVREGRRSGELQVRIVTTDGELDAPGLAQSLHERLGEQLSGVLWTRTASLAETTAGGATELVWGEPQLQERVGDLDVRISAEAFFQTNTEMAERLYEQVAAFAGLQGWERVYDLYCGIGTIAMSLARRAGEVWGIELVEQAVADAIEGAQRNEITNVRFFAGDVRTALPELLQRAGRPDVLVVDPPRAGLSKAVVRRIVEAAPRRIVYVSCNPTTLAPNAAELVQAGWVLRRMQPVDMFAHTHHIECVAELVRG
jgi:tRNA/tmRNA/rRNA uracil-C5-methylase (TrmA/RlmC/RlmD family)